MAYEPIETKDRSEDSDHVKEWLESVKLGHLYSACLEDGWDDLYVNSKRRQYLFFISSHWSFVNNILTMTY